MVKDKNTVSRELLCTKIVREIISLISSGTYPEGRKLPSERDLCEKFTTSRGTIRQSLSDLEKLGVIKIKPNSGAYVQKFSYSRLTDKLLPKDFQNVSLDDIIQARKVIETAAIEARRHARRKVTGPLDEDQGTSSIDHAALIPIWNRCASE